MIVRAGDRSWRGSVLDLRDTDLEPGEVLAGIRGESGPVRVRCVPPSGLHDLVGHVHPGMTVRARSAVAAAGRSRGLSTPHDEELATLRARIGEKSEERGPPARPTGAAVAERDRLRERVAELRGRVQSLEAAGEDPTEARAALREAARRLSEVETDRLASREHRHAVRSLRDERERRMRREDRVANLERAARAHLVSELEPEFHRAVRALSPGVEDPFEAAPDVCALAAAGIGDVRAPVVLRVRRFASPTAAAEWLDAPVLWL